MVGSLDGKLIIALRGPLAVHGIIRKRGFSVLKYGFIHDSLLCGLICRDYLLLLIAVCSSFFGFTATMQKRLVQAKLTHRATADGHDLLTIARAREDIVYRGRGNLDAAITSTLDVSTRRLHSSYAKRSAWASI